MGNNRQGNPNNSLHSDIMKHKAAVRLNVLNLKSDQRVVLGSSTV